MKSIFTLCLLLIMAAPTQAQYTPPPQTSYGTTVDQEYNQLCTTIQLRMDNPAKYDHKTTLALIEKRQALWPQTSYYKAGEELKASMPALKPAPFGAYAAEDRLMEQLSTPTRLSSGTSASAVRSRSNPQVLDIYTTNTPVSGTQVWIYRRE